jgi:hypothetical protein
MHPQEGRGIGIVDERSGIAIPELCGLNKDSHCGRFEPALLLRRNRNKLVFDKFAKARKRCGLSTICEALVHVYAGCRQGSRSAGRCRKRLESDLAHSNRP